VRESGLTFQIGNNRRFAPGMAAAQRFVRDELGAVLTLDAWYYDSLYRYTMQDNLYPVPVETAHSKRPSGEWKANRERYLLLTHASARLSSSTLTLRGGPSRISLALSNSNPTGRPSAARSISTPGAISSVLVTAACRRRR